MCDLLFIFYACFASLSCEDLGCFRLGNQNLDLKPWTNALMAGHRACIHTMQFEYDSSIAPGIQEICENRSFLRPFLTILARFTLICPLRAYFGSRNKLTTGRRNLSEVLYKGASDCEIFQFNAKSENGCQCRRFHKLKSSYHGSPISVTRDKNPFSVCSIGNSKIQILRSNSGFRNREYHYQELYVSHVNLVY